MMFQRLFFSMPVLMLGGLASASVYISDFSGASSGDSLEGVDLWSQNQVNPTGPGSPLTWVTTLGSASAGAIGAYYDLPSDPLVASRPIGTTFSSATLSLEFAIQDSTTDFSFRNDFSITIANGLGSTLFGLDFAAVSQFGLYDDPLDPGALGTSDALWNVSWDSLGAAGTPAFASVGEDSLYFLDLVFTPSGASDVAFNLTLQGPVGAPVTQSGTLNGLGGETFEDLEISFSQGSGADFGDNFMAFRGVPEPSTLVLALLSALGLLRRRRH